MTASRGYLDPRLQGPDSIARLGLPTQVQNALMRADIMTVSQVVDLVDDPGDRLAVRGIGAKAWAALEEALDRPLLPMQSAGEEVST